MKIFFLSMMALAMNFLTVNAQGYQVGDAVKDFSLKNVDGKQVSLAQLDAAKGYIVVFTCNTCPYAKAYETRVEALNKQYAAHGYPVIAINTNDPEAAPGDSFDKMQQRAKEHNFSYPYLYDEGQHITKQFGATRTPQVYIVSKTADKSLQVAYIGAIDDDTENVKASKKLYVQNAVDALLQGKKPELNFTKAVGCTVKWKKS